MTPIEITSYLPTLGGHTLRGVKFTPIQLTLSKDRAVLQGALSHDGHDNVQVPKHAVSPALEFALSDLPQALLAALDELARKGLIDQRLELAPIAEPTPPAAE
jgi:hypothetical protein